MKKILWLCNTPLPQIARKYGIRSCSEGWLEGISDVLNQNREIDLTVLFPQTIKNKLLFGSMDGIKYYGFYKVGLYNRIPDKKTISAFEQIIKRAQPDLVHIFGTESTHSLEMIEAVKKKVKVVVSIQGFVTACERYCLGGIPIADCYKPGIFNGRIDCIASLKTEFYYRTKIELEVLRKIHYAIGRTTWDKVMLQSINCDCKYLHCNENLRKSFYEAEWSCENIDKYSILLSQGYYPVKGTHYMLEALDEIRKRFPKTHLYIAGPKEFILPDSMTPYGKYIRDMIEKRELKKYVTFLGVLNENSMRERLKKSHILALTSNIENSPNSVGEAMLLGTPVVAAYVGGVGDFIEHGQDGFLYQHNEPGMLAHYIERMFADKEVSEKMSVLGKIKARQIFDREHNNNKLLEVYEEIINISKKNEF